MTGFLRYLEYEGHVIFAEENKIAADIARKERCAMRIDVPGEEAT